MEVTRPSAKSKVKSKGKVKQKANEIIESKVSMPTQKENEGEIENLQNDQNDEKDMEIISTNDSIPEQNDIKEKENDPNEMNEKEEDGILVVPFPPGGQMGVGEGDGGVEVIGDSLPPPPAYSEISLSHINVNNTTTTNNNNNSINVRTEAEGDGEMVNINIINLHENSVPSPPNALIPPQDNTSSSSSSSSSSSLSLSMPTTTPDGDMTMAPLIPSRPSALSVAKFKSQPSAVVDNNLPQYSLPVLPSSSSRIHISPSSLLPLSSQQPFIGSQESANTTATGVTNAVTNINMNNLTVPVLPPPTVEISIDNNYQIDTINTRQRVHSVLSEQLSHQQHTVGAQHAASSLSIQSASATATVSTAPTVSSSLASTSTTTTSATTTTSSPSMFHILHAASLVSSLQSDTLHVQFSKSQQLSLKDSIETFNKIGKILSSNDSFYQLVESYVKAKVSEELSVVMNRNLISQIEKKISSVWTISTQTMESNSQCGDGTIIRHTVNYDIANLGPNSLNELHISLNDLHKKGVSELSSKRFFSSRCQMEVEIFLFELISKCSLDNNKIQSMAEELTTQNYYDAKNGSKQSVVIDTILANVLSSPLRSSSSSMSLPLSSPLISHLRHSIDVLFHFDDFQHKIRQKYSSKYQIPLDSEDHSSTLMIRKWLRLTVMTLYVVGSAVDHQYIFQHIIRSKKAADYLYLIQFQLANWATLRPYNNSKTVIRENMIQQQQQQQQNNENKNNNSNESNNNNNNSNNNNVGGVTFLWVEEFRLHFMEMFHLLLNPPNGIQIPFHVIDKQIEKLGNGNGKGSGIAIGMDREEKKGDEKDNENDIDFGMKSINAIGEHAAASASASSSLSPSSPSPFSSSLSNDFSSSSDDDFVFLDSDAKVIPPLSSSGFPMSEADFIAIFESFPLSNYIRSLFFPLFSKRFSRHYNQRHANVMSSHQYRMGEESEEKNELIYSFARVKHIIEGITSAMRRLGEGEEIVKLLAKCLCQIPINIIRCWRDSHVYFSHSLHNDSSVTGLWPGPCCAESTFQWYQYVQREIDFLMLRCTAIINNISNVSVRFLLSDFPFDSLSPAAAGQVFFVLMTNTSEVEYRDITMNFDCISLPKWSLFMGTQMGKSHRNHFSQQAKQRADSLHVWTAMAKLSSCQYKINNYLQFHHEDNKDNKEKKDGKNDLTVEEKEEIVSFYSFHHPPPSEIPPPPPTSNTIVLPSDVLNFHHQFFHHRPPTDLPLVFILEMFHLSYLNMDTREDVYKSCEFLFSEVTSHHTLSISFLFQLIHSHFKYIGSAAVSLWKTLSLDMWRPTINDLCLIHYDLIHFHWKSEEYKREMGIYALQKFNYNAQITTGKEGKQEEKKGEIQRNNSKYQESKVISDDFYSQYLENTSDSSSHHNQNQNQNNNKLDEKSGKGDHYVESARHHHSSASHSPSHSLPPSLSPLSLSLPHPHTYTPLSGWRFQKNLLLWMADIRFYAKKILLFQSNKNNSNGNGGAQLTLQTELSSSLSPPPLRFFNGFPSIEWNSNEIFNNFLLRPLSNFNETKTFQQKLAETGAATSADSAVLSAAVSESAASSLSSALPSLPSLPSIPLPMGGTLSLNPFSSSSDSSVISPTSLPLSFFIDICLRIRVRNAFCKLKVSPISYWFPSKRYDDEDSSSVPPNDFENYMKMFREDFILIYCQMQLGWFGLSVEEFMKHGYALLEFAMKGGESEGMASYNGPSLLNLSFQLLHDIIPSVLPPIILSSSPPSSFPPLLRLIMETHRPRMTSMISSMFSRDKSVVPDGIFSLSHVIQSHISSPYPVGIDSLKFWLSQFTFLAENSQRKFEIFKEGNVKYLMDNMCCSVILGVAANSVKLTSLNAIRKEMFENKMMEILKWIQEITKTVANTPSPSSYSSSTFSIYSSASSCSFLSSSSFPLKDFGLSHEFDIGIDLSTVKPKIPSNNSPSFTSPPPSLWSSANLKTSDSSSYVWLSFFSLLSETYLDKSSWVRWGVWCSLFDFTQIALKKQMSKYGLSSGEVRRESLGRRWITTAMSIPLSHHAIGLFWQMAFKLLFSRLQIDEKQREGILSSSSSSSSWFSRGKSNVSPASLNPFGFYGHLFITGTSGKLLLDQALSRLISLTDEIKKSLSSTPHMSPSRRHRLTELSNLFSSMTKWLRPHPSFPMGAADYIHHLSDITQKLFDNKLSVDYSPNRLRDIVGKQSYEFSPLWFDLLPINEMRWNSQIEMAEVRDNEFSLTPYYVAKLSNNVEMEANVISPSYRIYFTRKSYPSLLLDKKKFLTDIHHSFEENNKIQTEISMKLFGKHLMKLKITPLSSHSTRGMSSSNDSNSSLSLLSPDTIFNVPPVLFASFDLLLNSHDELVVTLRHCLQLFIERFNKVSALDRNLMDILPRLYRNEEEIITADRPCGSSSLFSGQSTCKLPAHFVFRVIRAVRQSSIDLLISQNRSESTKEIFSLVELNANFVSHLIAIKRLIYHFGKISNQNLQNSNNNNNNPITIGGDSSTPSPSVENIQLGVKWLFILAELDSPITSLYPPTHHFLRQSLSVMRNLLLSPSQCTFPNHQSLFDMLSRHPSLIDILYQTIDPIRAAATPSQYLEMFRMALNVKSVYGCGSLQILSRFKMITFVEKFANFSSSSSPSIPSPPNSNSSPPPSSPLPVVVVDIISLLQSFLKSQCSLRDQSTDIAFQREVDLLTHLCVELLCELIQSSPAESFIPSLRFLIEETKLVTCVQFPFNVSDLKRIYGGEKGISSVAPTWAVQMWKSFKSVSSSRLPLHVIFNVLRMISTLFSDITHHPYNILIMMENSEDLNVNEKKEIISLLKFRTQIPNNFRLIMDIKEFIMPIVEFATTLLGDISSNTNANNNNANTIDDDTYYQWAETLFSPFYLFDDSIPLAIDSHFYPSEIISENQKFVFSSFVALLSLRKNDNSIPHKLLHIHRAHVIKHRQLSSIKNYHFAVMKIVPLIPLEISPMTIRELGRDLQKIDEESENQNGEKKKEEKEIPQEKKEGKSKDKEGKKKDKDKGTLTSPFPNPLSISLSPTKLSEVSLFYLKFLSSSNWNFQFHSPSRSSDFIFDLMELAVRCLIEAESFIYFNDHRIHLLLQSLLRWDGMDFNPSQNDNNVDSPSVERELNRHQTLLESLSLIMYSDRTTRRRQAENNQLSSGSLSSSSLSLEGLKNQWREQNGNIENSLQKYFLDMENSFPKYYRKSSSSININGGDDISHQNQNFFLRHGSDELFTIEMRCEFVFKMVFTLCTTGLSSLYSPSTPSLPTLSLSFKKIRLFTEWSLSTFNVDGPVALFPHSTYAELSRSLLVSLNFTISPLISHGKLEIFHLEIMKILMEFLFILNLESKSTGNIPLCIRQLTLEIFSDFPHLSLFAMAAACRSIISLEMMAMVLEESITTFIEYFNDNQQGQGQGEEEIVAVGDEKFNFPKEDPSLSFSSPWLSIIRFLNPPSISLSDFIAICLDKGHINLLTSMGWQRVMTIRGKENKDIQNNNISYDYTNEYCNEMEQISKWMEKVKVTATGGNTKEKDKEKRENKMMECNAKTIKSSSYNAQSSSSSSSSLFVVPFNFSAPSDRSHIDSEDIQPFKFLLFFHSIMGWMEWTTQRHLTRIPIPSPFLSSLSASLHMSFCRILSVLNTMGIDGKFGSLLGAIGLGNSKFSVRVKLTCRIISIMSDATVDVGTIIKALSPSSSQPISIQSLSTLTDGFIQTKWGKFDSSQRKFLVFPASPLSSKDFPPSPFIQSVISAVHALAKEKQFIPLAKEILSLQFEDIVKLANNNNNGNSNGMLSLSTSQSLMRYVTTMVSHILFPTERKMINYNNEILTKEN